MALASSGEKVGTETAAGCDGAGNVGAVGTEALVGSVDSIFTGLLSRPVCKKNIQEAALGDKRKSRLLFLLVFLH